MNTLENPQIKPTEKEELITLLKEVTEAKQIEEYDIKFGVGMSQDKDPTNAGREASEKAIEQLNGKPVKFMLIFSTSHYDNKNSRNKLISTCREWIAEDTPSIGGTVTGFICPEGFAVRGVVVLAASGNFDVSSGMFNKIRSKPDVAGKVVGKKISSGLSRSNKANKIIFNFISGPKESEIWTTYLVKNLISKVPYPVFLKLRDVLCSLAANYMQQGVGFEDIILESMENEIQDYYMFGSGTFDDMKARKNSVFYNNNSFPSALASLGISLDNRVIRKRYFPLIHSGKEFRIKRGWKNYWIDEINGKPAVMGYSELLGYPRYFMGEHTERFTYTLFQLPFGYEFNGYEYAFPTGFFMGKSILTNLQIKSDTVELLYTSTALFLKTMKDYFKSLDDGKDYFTFCSAVGVLVGSFGSKIRIIKEVLDEGTKGRPYLLIFNSADFFKTPETRTIVSDYALSFLSIED